MAKTELERGGENCPKVYFACSIRGGRDQSHVYPALIQSIKETGVEVLSEIFADQKLTADGMNKPSNEIHKIDMRWVRESDALIAELTTPSTGAGYEIGKAEEFGKPILALFDISSGRKLSAMIEGSPDTEVVYYEELNVAAEGIKEFIERHFPRHVFRKNS